MSIMTGGRADKLGNRYEGRWVAYNLIRLVAGDFSAVQLEGVEEDELGVDLWVTDRDGLRDASQCKRKNRTAGKWGIGELHRQGVLGKLAAQLRRDAAIRFTCVSSHPAPELRELTDAARLSGGDHNAFFREIQATQAHEPSLRQFCTFVSVDMNQEEGRREAFDLLRRTYTHLFEDSREGDAFLGALARCHISGDPAAVVEALANYAQERLGERITIDDLRRHLIGRGFNPVHLAGIPNIGETLDRLRSQFRESLRIGLSNDDMIDRPEADAVLNLVRDPGAKQLIVLHGRAGTGKSTVLLQLIERLETAGIPFLPLRLDRRPPAVSAQRYGIDQCGLPESPAVVLRSVYSGQPSVLILDQLDAVRWSMAHASAPWEACQEVIDEALGFPHVLVVVACRSFDLRDDAHIRTWHDRRQGHEIEVGELSESDVVAAVVAAGGSVDALTGRQRQLLRSPLHLALWRQIRRSGLTEPFWNTQADLMRAFWKSRYEAMEQAGVPHQQYRTALESLVTAMDRRGELSVPAHSLDQYPSAADALKSLNLIVEADRRVVFSHQSYFEYLLAIRLVEHVSAGEKSVAGWVQGSDQSLLRREQLRLVLTLLRDDSPRHFVTTARNILSAADGQIRFHLKQLVLGLMGDIAVPNALEIDLVCDLARLPEWRDHVYDLVLTRRPGWFDAIDDRGLPAEWLAASDDSLNNLAVQLCRWMSKQRGDRVAELLGPRACRPDPWPRRVALALLFDPSDDTDSLFALRLRLIRERVYRQEFLAAEKLATSRPERCVALLEALFESREADSEQGESRNRRRHLPYLIPQHEVEHLERVAKTLPDLVWRQLVPHVVRTCERTRQELPGTQDARRYYPDSTWSELWRMNRRDGNVEILALIAKAGAILASRHPEEFGTELQRWLDHPARSVQHLLGLMFAWAGPETADLAVRWLCNGPSRLSIPDEEGRPWGIGRLILMKHAPHCSDVLYRQLEEVILRYHDTYEWRSVEYQVYCVQNGLALAPNDIGKAQHGLLPALPPNRISTIARSKMGVLERKFGRPGYDTVRRRTGRVRSLTSPVPEDRARTITDAGWQAIIRSVRSRNNSRRYRDVGEHHFTETSPESFAQLLGPQARASPTRFAALALRFPEETLPEYLSAIVYNIRDKSPPNPEPQGWIPAADEHVAAVVERIGYRNEFELGRGVCWLVRDRPSAPYSSACRDSLRRYVTEHPHPIADDWVVSQDGEPDLDAAAINSVRGSALDAVERILFDRPELVTEFLPAIQQAVRDPSPVVRVAAVGACLPLLNTARDLAIDLFLQACETDDRVLASHNVNEFLRYTLATHLRRMEPLIDRMARSTHGKVATQGAAWVAVNWLHDRVARPVLDECRRGTSAQRKGIAIAAAHNCLDRELVSGCAELLVELLGDLDDDVQGAIPY